MSIDLVDTITALASWGGSS